MAIALRDQLEERLRRYPISSLQIMDVTLKEGTGDWDLIVRATVDTEPDCVYVFVAKNVWAQLVAYERSAELSPERNGLRGDTVPGGVTMFYVEMEEGLHGVNRPACDESGQALIVVGVA
ncbi:MAG: hypothetical protein ACRDHV_00065 [Actinomycetota bacterium]